MTSSQRMESIHRMAVPSDSIALWFLGQNGFVFKTSNQTRIALDPYLTNSCGDRKLGYPLDLGRALPILLEPEDLDVDLFVVTHSHEDHLDEETVRRLRCQPRFIAPWQAAQKLQTWGIEAEQIEMLHPLQKIVVDDVQIEGTFALPTDSTDLNHIGLLFTFSNGIRFYNTGDTAYAEALTRLIPSAVDICAICINGGFHNLSHGEAARLTKVIAPHTVIPTHYDMMNCNRSNPDAFRIALQHEGVPAIFHQMSYDYPFVYTREARK